MLEYKHALDYCLCKTQISRTRQYFLEQSWHPWLLGEKAHFEKQLSSAQLK